MHMSLPLYQRLDMSNDSYPYKKLHTTFDSYVLYLVFSSNPEFKTREWCEWTHVFWPQVGVDTVEDLIYVDIAMAEDSAAWNQVREADKHIIAKLFGLTPDGYASWVE